MSFSTTIETSGPGEAVLYAESRLTAPDGGIVRVLLYRSPVVEDGVSVQIETDDLTSYVAVMLNDGDLFSGNPEGEADTRWYIVVDRATLAGDWVSPYVVGPYPTE